jgi:hypothetical protein
MEPAGFFQWGVRCTAVFGKNSWIGGRIKIRNSDTTAHEGLCYRYDDACPPGEKHVTSIIPAINFECRNGVRIKHDTDFAD